MANNTLKFPAIIPSGVLLLLAFAVHADGENPHIVSKTVTGVDCLSCHINQPENNSPEALETKNKSVHLTDFKNDGVAMCSNCHNPDDGHKIGLKLDFDVPADMPLDKKNALSCLTCHYTHGKLSTERPQASFSFMDRLVDAERLHKSFLLRRNNVDGELCLICHNPDQGKK
ncbi:MAG: hypothetical protein ABL925_12280 [Methylococcales bacterium]